MLGSLIAVVRRTRRPLLVVLALAVVGVSVLAGHARGPGRHEHRLRPTSSHAHASSTRNQARPRARHAEHSSTPSASRKQQPRPSYCHRPSGGQFVPTSVSIPGLINAAPVLALSRDSTNHPGVAPVDESGKHEFAWDRPPGLMPGSVGGNVLLNAHTWPWDQSPALGNLMLRGLRTGDIIDVRGAGQHLCYRVTDRVQQPADSTFARYYTQVGPPQLAIMVCSGVRRGPEDWADRTVWFASPMA